MRILLLPTGTARAEPVSQTRATLTLLPLFSLATLLPCAEMLDKAISHVDSQHIDEAAKGALGARYVLVTGGIWCLSDPPVHFLVAVGVIHTYRRTARTVSPAACNTVVALHYGCSFPTHGRLQMMQDLLSLMDSTENVTVSVCVCVCVHFFFFLGGGVLRVVLAAALCMAKCLVHVELDVILSMLTEYTKKPETA